MDARARHKLTRSRRLTRILDSRLTFFMVWAAAAFLLLLTVGCSESENSEDPNELDMMDTSGDGGDMNPCNSGDQLAPAPFECTDNSECAMGEVCAPSSQCFPSSCVCDPATGETTCTTDCRQVNTCQPGNPACEGPDPSQVVTCADEVECAPNQVCAPAPNCVPSSCTCDEATGAWACTDDCGSPNICQPDTTTCEGPNPAEVETCVDSEECGQQEVCMASPTCVPSACSCNQDGNWECTADCGSPDVCVPVPGNGCDTPNPAGCTAPEDCAETEVCVRSLNNCLPSSCVCDAETGTWGCSEDCGGGVCQEAKGACTSDADCPMGQQWCENGQCVECDNSGLACDIACQEGFQLEERNGCFPCNCVPINECTSDQECRQNQSCVPGDMCLSFCEVGDPTCCYGNTCQ